MKKVVSKLFVSLFLIVYIITMSSCVLPSKPEPYGIWVSSDPELILYVNPEDRAPDALNSGLYSGEYLIAGISISILINIDMRTGQVMKIYDSSAQAVVDGEIVLYGGLAYEYFGGTITIRDNKMLYVLYDAWQEETGYEKIVFEKIEDYPMPEEE
jgi:hypothetical protein